jgi:hypothetical protein
MQSVIARALLEPPPAEPGADRGVGIRSGAGARHPGDGMPPSLGARRALRERGADLPADGVSRGIPTCWLPPISSSP